MAEGGEPSMAKEDGSREEATCGPLDSMLNAATNIELDSPDVNIMRKDRRDRTRAAMLVSLSFGSCKIWHLLLFVVSYAF